MENYKNKYLKYKNKYLILKSKINNMIGGLTDEEKRNLIEQNFSSQTNKKRIFAEIKKLEEKGYNVDLSEIDSKKIIVTDTIPLRQKSSKIIVLSVAELLDDVIIRVSKNKSISGHFQFPTIL